MTVTARETYPGIISYRHRDFWIASYIDAYIKGDAMSRESKILLPSSITASTFYTAQDKHTFYVKVKPVTYLLIIHP